jgi:hypothetical protein
MYCTIVSRPYSAFRIMMQLFAHTKIDLKHRHSMSQLWNGIGNAIYSTHSVRSEWMHSGQSNY